MTSVPDNDGQSTLSGELGDVLAIVDSPERFRFPERSWQNKGVDAAAIAVGSLLPGGALTTWAVPLIVLAVKAGQAPAASTQPHVALMAVKDARKLADRNLLHFPQGGPGVGEVYGRHPLRPRDYLPFAGLHRSVLHEKCIETARYLLALGARDIEISCHQIKGKETKADAGIAVPDLEDVSLTMGFGRDDSGKLAIRVKGAGKRRRQPADLIWPSHDAMFKLANEAASSGAEAFHFGLRAEQSGAVNARAAVKLQKDLGLSLGGEYKRWEDLSFTVDATFGTRSLRD